MPHPIYTLVNGIKLIHRQIDSPISHFGILINAGSRDEKDEKTGLAHFVEHTIFKGTTKRKGFQIIRRMEDVGGDLNASTSKEETYFHASFLSPDYERAIELLADIFFNATFPEKEIEKEKDVVLEEIKYYEDTPSELIFDEFENQVYANHSIGRNILGSRKTVRALKRQDIIDFIHDNYTLGNVVISSVGNISTEKIMKLCNHYFASSVLKDEVRLREPFENYHPENIRKNRNTRQAHALFGNLAYSFKDDRKTPFYLLTNLLGGQGMNTRLNMAVREKNGLAYTVEANYSPFSDTGLFSIYLGCDTGMLEKCTNLIFKELEKLKTQSLGTLQLHHAKKQFLGQWAIANEAKLSEMLSLGRSALFYDEVETIDEAMEKIEAVSGSDILEVANQIFQRDRFSSLIYAKK